MMLQPEITPIMGQKIGFGSTKFTWLEHHTSLGADIRLDQDELDSFAQLD